jgi:hypothetical protein
MNYQSPDAQALLWSLPNYLGNGWWYICSGISLAAAMTMFLYMIMNEKASALLAARVMIWLGLICFSLVPLNSGWVPWGVMIISMGALYTSFLIATDWCIRHDKWRVIRDMFSRQQERHAGQHRNGVD